MSDPVSSQSIYPSDNFSNSIPKITTNPTSINSVNSISQVPLVKPKTKPKPGLNSNPSNTIIYQDFVKDISLSSYITHLTLTNPNANNVLDRVFEFNYGIFLRKEDLDKQASAFALSTVNQPTFYTSFTPQIWNNDVYIEKLAELYKYSYYKSLFLIHEIYFNNMTYSYSSKLFWGHSYLVKTFRSRTIQYLNTEGSSDVRKNLVFDEHWYDYMMSDPFAQSIIDNNGYIAEIEPLFLVLENKIPSLVVDELSSVSPSVKESSCPLGNFCFSININEEQKFHYLNTGLNSRNFNSIYWNSACGIVLLDQEYLYSDESIYRTIPSSAITNKRYLFEMSSITGLKVLTDNFRKPGGSANMFSYIRKPFNSPRPLDLGPKISEIKESSMKFDKSVKGKSIDESVDSSGQKPGISEDYSIKYSGPNDITRFAINSEYNSMKHEIYQVRIPDLDKFNIMFSVIDGILIAFSKVPSFVTSKHNYQVDIKQQLSEFDSVLVDLKARVLLQENNYKNLLKDLIVIQDKINSGDVLTYLDILLVQKTTNIIFVDIYAINSNIVLNV